MATDELYKEGNTHEEGMGRERTGEHSHAHQHYGGLVEHHPDQPDHLAWTGPTPVLSHHHKHSHGGRARMKEVVIFSLALIGVAPEDAHE